MTACESLQATHDAPQSDFVDVYFSVPAFVGGRFADVVGDFLTWVPMAMDKQDDGSFTASIRLQSRRSWRYRFMVDGERWINDGNADDYVTHTDGSVMSVKRT